MADSEEIQDVDETPEVQQEAERRHTMAMQESGPLKEGDLMKQGGNFKTWKKRHFALLPTSITYFETKGGKIKGGILMESVIGIRPSKDAETKKPFAFTIETTTGRAYIQHASSQEEMDAWIASIQKVVPEKLTAPVSIDEESEVTTEETSKEDSAATTTETTNTETTTTEAATATVTDSTGSGADGSDGDDKFVVHYWPGFAGRTYAMSALLEDVGANYEMVTDAEEFIFMGGNKGYPAFAVPALVHKGKTISQTIAILSYLGEVLNKSPTDPVSKAHCLQVALNAIDFGTEVDKARESHDTKTGFLAERCGKWISMLEQELAYSEGTYFFGDEPMYCDYQVLQVFETFNLSLGDGHLPALPANLQKFYDAMLARPKLKTYIDNLGASALPPFLMGIKPSPTPISRLENCKVSYFGIPGRGEPIRIALAHAGVKFTNDVIDFKAWGEMKDATPWGSVPVVELADGSKLAQGRAVLRFVGKHTGLYPADAVQAERCDELLDVMDDITMTINNAGKGLETEEQFAARLAACTADDGALKKTLTRMEAFVGTHGSDGYSVGTAVSIGDVAVFQTVCNLVCGFWDGVPKDLFEAYPRLSAITKMFGSLPNVAAWYASEGHGEGMEAIYKSQAN